MIFFNLDVIYKPHMSGSGQFGLCEKCNMRPTKEGHDGCLGTLDESVVMNACCGHGEDELAYIQYWGGECIRDGDAIKEQARMKELNK